MSAGPANRISSPKIATTVQQYSTDELVHLITTNNLAGVHARLVSEGRVSGSRVPNVEAIAYAIEEQSKRLAPEAFIVWLEQLLDVPVDQNGLYASELTAIGQSTGKTPARLMTDQIRQTMPQTDSASGFYTAKWPWFTWVFIALAFIGLLCVLRYAGRILEKVTG